MFDFCLSFSVLFVCILSSLKSWSKVNLSKISRTKLQRTKEETRADTIIQIHHPPPPPITFQEREKGYFTISMLLCLDSGLKTKVQRFPKVPRMPEVPKAKGQKGLLGDRVFSRTYFKIKLDS